MWPYRLALAFGDPLKPHKRVAIREETDPELRRLVAERFFQQGRLLQSRGRLPDALAMLLRGSFVDPEFGALHRAVGDIFQQLERHLEAMPWLERAVELEPTNAAWRVQLATAFEATGRPDEALYHFRAARQLDSALATAQAGVERMEAWIERSTQAKRHKPWWLTPSGL